MRIRQIFCALLLLGLFLRCDENIFAKNKLWKAAPKEIKKGGVKLSFDTPILLKENPWLLNKSSWSLYIDRRLRRSRLGAFGIGNGKVFTLMGLNLPLNTFHNMTGPTYSHPFFGDEWIELKIGKEKVNLPKQWIWQVRGAGVVITKEIDDNVELYTVNFVPPDLEAIVRVIIIRNISDNIINDLSLSCKLFGDKEERGGELLQRRGERLLFLGCLDKDSYIKEGDLIIPLGNIKKEEEKLTIHYLCLNKKEKEKIKIIKILNRERLKLLEKTKNYWEDWLSHSLKVISPDEKVNDLIEGMKIALKIQQMSSGAQTPVVKYADRSHDRENVNISRFLLTVGKYNDVKEIIQFCYKVAIKTGKVLNSQDILTNIDNLPPEPDWSKVPLDNINNDYHTAERPSWTILQFYWYYKYTNDLELIKKCYPYLKRNLTGQEVSEDFLLPFHGDEMYQATFPFYVSKVSLSKMYSADSSFTFVAAAEGMQEIAQACGELKDSIKFKELANKVRTSAEKYYWQEDLGFYAPAMLKDSKELIKRPFSDINLKPIWTGYIKDLSRARRNLLELMKILSMPDGTLKMAEFADVYHGQIPGLFLYNLAYLDHPYAETAFNSFNFIADPAGQFSEAHGNNHLSVCMNTDPSGFKKEDARRFGPWEGSVNAYSIVYYLTGIRIDAQKNELYLLPHLPNNWDKLQVKNCYIRENPVEFTVSELDGERVYLIENKGEESVFVNLTVSLKKAEVKELLINDKKQDINSFTIENEWGCLRIKDIKMQVMSHSKMKVKVKFLKMD